MSKETSGSIAPTSVNFADLLIPENIFNSLANNIVPAVVIFSLLFGLALMFLNEKQNVMSSLKTVLEALTGITAWISRITPIGTFIIIAKQTGTIELAAVKQISTYIILYILGLGIVTFWIFPRIVSGLTGIRALRWLKDMLPVLVLAYTTNMVIICLPYIIAMLQKETERLHPEDENAKNQIQGIVAIVYNLPLSSFFIALFIFFASIYYQYHLSLGAQIELFFTLFLTSLGAVGLGAWINSLTFLLDSLGLPLDALNLYLTTLPFTSGFQMMLSAMQVASLSLLITFACRKLVAFKWHQILKSSLLTVAPIALLFIGIKEFRIFPEIKLETTTIYDLTISSNVKTTTFTNAPPSSTPVKEDPLDRIFRTKTLRVGYNPNTTPFCFYNHHGELVGYDVAFAYALAHDLGCQLEFVPMHYGTIVDELNNDLYDIGMSAVSINEERLKQLYFSIPYLDTHVVLVFKEALRKKYPSLVSIQKDPSAKIAVLKGSSFESLAKDLFPDKQLVLLDSYQSFSIEDFGALLLWEKHEAVSFLQHNPHYTLLVPNPPIGTDILGYPIKISSEKFLTYLNLWLELKKAEGFKEAQYNLWIMGETRPYEGKQPRWSILRNVLKWVE